MTLMNTDNKPPKKKRGEKASKPQGPAGYDSPGPDQPAADERTRNTGGTPADRSEQQGTPSEEEVVSTWNNPVTNQDEQEKITNAGAGDVPVPDK
jgi:hypothetical protein